MVKPASWAPVVAVLAVLARPAAAQDSDPAQAHMRMYKRIAPSVVYVYGGGQRGTGVIVDKQGYVLTSPTACGHTTTGATVVLHNQKRVSGKVVGRVNELELVVVKIDERDLAAVELGDSDKTKLGAVTYVFGDSFESMARDGHPAISVGVLSSVYEVTVKHRGTLYTGPVLETSCAVNPEQDGGPLVDAGGRLIGIVTLNYDESKFTGVAVPINRLKPEIERIIRSDREGIAGKQRPPDDPSVKKGAEPGWLGADVQEGDETDGLLVAKVFKNGPAQKGGLLKGDVIRAVNGQRVRTARRFADIFGRLEEGARVTLQVARDGKELELTVTLGRKTYY